MEISKVEGWLGPMGYEFWVWPYWGGVTASLKFRQFKSAVCDAFGVILCFGEFAGGVACFVGCWGIGVTCFDTLYCLIDAWCLVIWLNVELLVINYLLRTCILFTRTCTITTIDRLTWGVGF